VAPLLEGTASLGRRVRGRPRAAQAVFRRARARFGSVGVRSFRRVGRPCARAVVSCLPVLLADRRCACPCWAWGCVPSPRAVRRALRPGTGTTDQSRRASVGRWQHRWADRHRGFSRIRFSISSATSGWGLQEVLRRFSLPCPAVALVRCTRRRTSDDALLAPTRFSRALARRSLPYMIRTRPADGPKPCFTTLPGFGLPTASVDLRRLVLRGHRADRRMRPSARCPPVVSRRDRSITPIFSRSWLNEIALCSSCLPRAVIFRMRLVHERSCRPTWLFAHLALELSGPRHELRHRVDHCDVERAGAEPSMRRSPTPAHRFLAATPSRICVAPTPGRIRVERVLSVDERGGMHLGADVVDRVEAATVVCAGLVTPRVSNPPRGRPPCEGHSPADGALPNHGELLRRSFAERLTDPFPNACQICASVQAPAPSASSGDAAICATPLGSRVFVRLPAAGGGLLPALSPASCRFFFCHGVTL